MGIRRVVALVLVLAALAVAPAGRAAAPPLERIGARPLAPGVTLEELRWSTPGGGQRITLVRFRVDDPRVRLTVEMARGQVPGRETVAELAWRLGDRAIAAINGSFLPLPEDSPGPDGDPLGLVVHAGRYVSEPQASAQSDRGAFALVRGGGWLVGRPTYVGEVWLPTEDGGVLTVPVAAVNRRPRPGEAVAFTDAFGPVTDAGGQAATELVLGVDLAPETIRTDVPVLEVRSGPGPTAAGRTVLVGTGPWAETFTARLRPGDRVTTYFHIGGWTDLEEAIAGGPLLLQGGAATTPAEWRAEGFDSRHNDRAHPRTVVAVTADGEILLIAVDGRQPPDRVGLTTAETLELVRQLGAVDAVMLDGGCSTQLVVDLHYANRPCMDDGRIRRVANALVVWTTADTPDVERLGGSDRFATAAQLATDGWPGGSGVAVLASGTAFPDALAGGPLAAGLGAPLLLTAPGALPAVTRQALIQLGVRRAVVLGGEAAVAPAVVDELAAMGISVRRIGGATRIETAEALAAELGAPNQRAILASAAEFADALSATVPAATARAPLLLTWPEGIAATTLDTLRQLGVREVVIAGGPRAVGTAVEDTLRTAGFAVTRIAGPDRYGTSVALLRWARTLPTDQVVVASGRTFPDALAGGPYAVRVGAPLVLVDPEDIDCVCATDTRTYLEQDTTLRRATILGGRVAVSSWVGFQLQDIIDGR